MRRALALLFLIGSLIVPGSSPVLHAQELASESYAGSGWSMRWDPKIVQLVSTSDFMYDSDLQGCNLALAYPRFEFCARNFDRALAPASIRFGDDPADSVQALSDALYPDAEPVPDDLTSRPPVDSGDIAWQLFADSPASSGDNALLASDAVYIEVRRLSPDEWVTLIVTGLTVDEFEIAAGEIEATLASVQRREPTFTDPTLGWSVAWNHEHLRPSAIPDPDPTTAIYLTEYTEAYLADGLDIDIFMSSFALPENQGVPFLDARSMVAEFNNALETADNDIDIVFEVPEGFESLEVWSRTHASGFVRFATEVPGFAVPDYWGMVDFRVIETGSGVLTTLLLWDAPHSEQVLPIFEDFFGSISLPGEMEPFPHRLLHPGCAAGCVPAIYGSIATNQAMAVLQRRLS